jgi:hypothetical protein
VRDISAPPRRPGDLDLHAQRAGLHRRFRGLLEDAAETNAADKLAGDALRDELRVHVRGLHFLDVEDDRLAAHAFELLAQGVDLGALAANEDAGAGRVDRDLGAVARALDQDAVDAGVVEARLDVVADLPVLGQPFQEGLLLGGVPARLPVADDAEAERDWIDFVSHGRGEL